jgi:hypothetical protein
MRINFFGCSFTEGGGLDNLEYYNIKTNSKLKDYSAPNSNILREYKEANRYSKIVGNLLNCESNNYAFGCNSNENIINKLYEVIKFNKVEKDDVFVVQTTIFSRKHFWYEPTNEFYSVNTIDFTGWPYQKKEIMKPLNQLYNLYYQYSHNEEYEIKKLLMQIEFINAWFREMGLKIFWIPWADLNMNGDWDILKEKNKELKKQNFIFFDDLAMGTYIDGNKYRICDEFESLTDRHKSTKGHKFVAEKIVEFLKEKL